MSESSFTGKEEDVEVGLQYFGKRYYAPLLGRWVSADPLAVHVPGEADLNLFAYVSGAALRAIDPLGLEGQYGESGPGNVPTEKDETLAPNEVGQSGGTQQAPHFSEKEFAAAACGATLGMACAGMSVSADSSGRADLKGDAEQAVAFLTYSPLRTAPARFGGARAARTAPAPAQVVGKSPKPAALTQAQLDAQLSRIEQQAVVRADASATEGVLERSSAPIAKYDGEFAARQLLGGDPVTPGGRTVMSHAAERMVKPPAGRSTMTMAEVDKVLDTADKVRKVTAHKEGYTVTVQSTKMPGKPQVVVDAQTGKRVITVVKGKVKGAE